MKKRKTNWPQVMRRSRKAARGVRRLVADDDGWRPGQLAPEQPKQESK